MEQKFYKNTTKFRTVCAVLVKGLIRDFK